MSVNRMGLEGPTFQAEVLIISSADIVSTIRNEYSSFDILQTVQYTVQYRGAL